MPRRLVVLTCCCAMLVGVAAAKRISPKPVAPLVFQGIEYSAHRDGRIQYVVATDTATSRELWRVEIFRTHIKPWIEEDNQWVFITNLTLSDGTLLIRDEKSRCYILDLTTRRVRKQRCP